MPSLADEVGDTMFPSLILKVLNVVVVPQNLTELLFGGESLLPVGLS